MKMLKSFVLMVIALMVCACMYSCASMPKSFNDMTPVEKSIMLNDLYSRQYDDYALNAARPNLTDEQKSLLRKKKDILTKAHPIILMYGNYVQSGIPITVEMEGMILQIFNDLQYGGAP